MQNALTRVQTIVMEACCCSEYDAQAALKAAGGQVKTAITMLLLSCSAHEALNILEQCKGHVRKALEQGI